MEIGKIGVWRVHRHGTDGVAEIESLGYGALWLGGSPSLDQARPFLEATGTMTVATGILNVWHHEPADVAALLSGCRDLEDYLLDLRGDGGARDAAWWRKALGATLAEA